MILALYIIGSTAMLLWLSAKLTEAHNEIARIRGESQNARGVALTLACLLVCAMVFLAAASRYAARKGAGE
jgi:hypothetical protein